VITTTIVAFQLHLQVQWPTVKEHFVVVLWWSNQTLDKLDSLWNF